MARHAAGGLADDAGGDNREAADLWRNDVTNSAFGRVAASGDPDPA
jgi:hypothetical protein